MNQSFLVGLGDWAVSTVTKKSFQALSPSYRQSQLNEFIILLIVFFNISHPNSLLSKQKLFLALRYLVTGLPECLLN